MSDQKQRDEHGRFADKDRDSGLTDVLGRHLEDRRAGQASLHRIFFPPPAEEAQEDDGPDEAA